MRVVAVTNQFPLPLDAGGPIRFHGLAKALAGAHDVHLLALARPSTTEELVREMEATTGGPVEAFSPSPARGFAARWATALGSGVPTYIGAQYSRELADRLRDLAPKADVVVLLDDYAGSYASVVAGAAPVVLDKSNVLGWSITKEPPPAGARQRLRHALAVHLIRRFERACLRRVERLIVTSEEESQRLERLYGRAADGVVRSGVELSGAPSAARGNRAVAWIGDHRYAPNVEGLVRFVEDGWEPLGEQGCRLLIAGREPPSEVRALERFPGVETVGFVERLDDLFGRCSAGVVPLWRGAGVKVKTLVLLGAGVPVAATPVALEGLGAESGRDCLVADEPPALADQLHRLLDDPALAKSLGGQGRRLVAESYTWDAVTPAFLELVEGAASASTRS